MAFQLSNHMPVELEPEHLIAINGDYDPLPAVKKVLVDPVYKGLVPGSRAVLLDDAGVPVDEDSLLQSTLRIMGGVVDPDADTDMRRLYGDACIHYTGTSHLRPDQVFPVQAQEKKRQKHPSPTVRYLAQSDVIPAAKQLLATGEDDEFLYSVAHAYSPETLGFWFLNDTAYTEFKDWMQLQLQPMQGSFPGDTNTALAQFYGSTLKGVTEGLMLRVDDADKLEEYSFARILVHMLMRWSMDQKAAWNAAKSPSGQSTQTQYGPNPRAGGVMAFSLGELFLPKSVVFANVEMHAHSSARRIDTEWRLITTSLQMKPTIIPNNRLASMTALPRALAKAKAQAANAQTNRSAQTGRSAQIRFRKRPPKPIDILTGLMAVLKRMGTVARSQNSIKYVKSTFARANRRRPDDPNYAGKAISRKYVPDIHLYLDCSGSVSEENYQDTVIMLIKLAKKLNVNLYFTSFSHVMSQPVLLRTANKSVNQIWQEFRSIRKVSGGTDYSQIWQLISQHPHLRRRLNLVITDFEWTAPTGSYEHPSTIYYAPLAGMDWNYMRRCAGYFTRSMRHIDPSIAAKIIGMSI